MTGRKNCTLPYIHSYHLRQNDFQNSISAPAVLSPIHHGYSMAFSINQMTSFNSESVYFAPSEYIHPFAKYN